MPSAVRRRQVACTLTGDDIHVRLSTPIALEPAVDGAAATSWTQLCVTGSFKKGERKFAITPAMLREMVANFDEGRHPVPPTELCIDYEHLSATETDNPEAGKAAGWIKALELRGDGSELWGRIEWTEKAAALIKAKEFRLISPEFAFNFTTPANDTIGCTLLAAAITNRPFLQGMEPIALTATRGDATLTSDLAYDQQRMLVQAALRQRARALGTDEWCYVTAMNGGRVVYECAGGFARESYSIDADGTVTFGDDAEEVIVTYRPPTEAALRYEDTTMKAITLKGTDGKDHQIGEDAIESLPIVVELRQQLAARVPKTDHDTLQARVVELGQEVATLRAQNDASARAMTERDADTAIERLVADGRATDGQRADLKALYLSDKGLFEKITAGFAKRVQTGEIGHAQPARTDGTAMAEVTAKVATLRAEHVKLTAEQAMHQVFEQDPALYARYVREAEVKVG